MWRDVMSLMLVLAAKGAVLTVPAAWGADAAAGGPVADAAKVDINKPGVYRAGLWEYHLMITSPGSKSQGARGILLFAGRPVDPAVRYDYYRTPWGDIQWVGDSELLWDDHGWMLRATDVSGGRELPVPWQQAGGPAVMAMVLRDAKETPKGEPFEPWVRAEMQRLGVKGFAIERRWFPLTQEAATIHDTKLYGSLTARLGPARDAATLAIVLDGTEPGRVELARQDGATGLVHRALGGVLDTSNYYLAFRVDRAALDWPRPLDIGLESDGKQVSVKGVQEIVIGLPGDRRSGCVWMVKRVQGVATATASVTSCGEPQFTPAIGEAASVARNGIFENVLRVISAGKCRVELEYKRNWQSDKPAEKTFAVTLDVQESPSGPAKP